MAEYYGENWVLVLAISFLFTWGVGLTPPLIIRFLIMRRSISKVAAACVVGPLWIFNIVLSEGLGSQSKAHGAWALIAIVSFFILVYRSRTKEEKVEALKERKAKEEEEKQRRQRSKADWDRER